MVLDQFLPRNRMGKPKLKLTFGAGRGMAAAGLGM